MWFGKKDKMTPKKSRIARETILLPDYRKRRLENLNLEISYWLGRRSQATTQLEREFCSRMLNMYHYRYKWYLGEGKRFTNSYISDELRKEVEGFIANFKDKNFYLNGFCYYFAVILQERFSQHREPREIWYNPVLNHFACDIDGVLFDVKGEVPFDTNWISWRNYREIEPLDSGRTEKYCILK